MAAPRVQMMELSKPASSRCAAAPHPAGAGFRTAALRMQMMELSKPARSPSTAAPHPAGAGCLTEARRLQMMELSESKPARFPLATEADSVTSSFEPQLREHDYHVPSESSLHERKYWY